MKQWNKIISEGAGSTMVLAVAPIEFGFGGLPGVENHCGVDLFFFGGAEGV